MRAQTQQHLKINGLDQQTLNIIKQTRKLIKGMPQQERFKKSLCHVKDALSYRQPRIDIYNPQLPKTFKTMYKIQTSTYWNWLMFLSCYVYMYTICLSPVVDYNQTVIIQSIILPIFWIDTIMYLYHKSFETKKISAKFSINFYVKISIIFLLTIDFFIYLSTVKRVQRIIRPFRILRTLLPLVFDPVTRKNFYALVSAYKDIFVFLIFYTCVILSFALISNQIIQLPPDMVPDQFTNNYTQFLKSIYVIYTLSSYDSYPDNQLIAIKWNIWTYAFFIIFVLLNIFFFTVIPSTIILDSFKQTRSKTLLIDEIKQQHSLILAFVSLGEENYNVNMNVFIRFLIFMYKHKVRYVNYITEVCLKLDNTKNGYIQISEFMQLCKIFNKNSQMMPPQFNDWKLWIQFRENIIKLTSIDEIVKTWVYQFISNLIVILTFFNCIAYIITLNSVLAVIDNVLLWIFVIEIIIRIVGLGPQNFFEDKWNRLDFILIVIILFVQSIHQDILSFRADVLLKMTRVFRITTLIKLLKKKASKQEYIKKQRNSIYDKTRQVVAKITIIIPTVLKFFPLLFITYYFLGIVSMELFYTASLNPQANKYNVYSQFSNFGYFMGTQFIFMQVLVEAGWSLICFDYVKRTGIYFPIILFFISLHVIIVLILAALLKGIVWQIYSAVNGQIQQNQKNEQAQRQKQVKNYKKKQQFNQIRQKIQSHQFIDPNTIIKRQFLQNKLDIQIFKRLKQIYVTNRHQRTQVIQIIVNSRKYIMDETFLNNEDQTQQLRKLYNKLIRDGNSDSQIIIEDQDLEEEMQQLMQKLILHPKIKYSQTIVYPKFIQELLQYKMRKPFDIVMPEKGFDMNATCFGNKDSIDFHAYEMNVLLEIERSERDQKLLIIKTMIDNKLIKDQQAGGLLAKKLFKKTYNIDFNWIIRKMFLSSTNQELINKFQIQYFSDLYGQSFKQINKVTIQPLLRYEALLTYNLRNILRYPDIQNNDFFQMLTKIQDSISNKLLKKGSLFKLVYQIQALADNWFTVQFKQYDDTKIHFIKTGIWIYNKQMAERQVYYAKDLFKWDTKDRPDRITCQKILKLLYQTFEGLAFGLLNQSEFFRSNPVHDIYDLYSFYIDVSQLKRINIRKLGISKIMLVILSKQEQRAQDQKLQYQLSEIITEKRPKKDIDFRFDESQKETFNKLKNLSALDHQKIIETQGLPFAYILNLLSEFKQNIETYLPTLVNQVQKVLNQQFQNV